MCFVTRLITYFPEKDDDYCVYMYVRITLTLLCVLSLVISHTFLFIPVIHHKEIKLMTTIVNKEFI